MIQCQEPTTPDSVQITAGKPVISCFRAQSTFSTRLAERTFKNAKAACTLACVLEKINSDLYFQ